MSRRRSAAAAAIGGVAALAVASWIYQPALDGPFLSDDILYIPENRHIQRLDAESVGALFAPLGDAARTSANYAPLHLLMHAVEWRAFGLETRGYHLVNVVLHVATAGLLVLVLRAGGVARLAAAFGGAFFLVHPANVEAVAWISQLKTIASTGLALAALLAWRRVPGLGGALFAAALLTKVSAAFALPIAAALAWSGRREAGARRRGAELAVWLALAVAVAIPQAIVQREGGLDSVEASADPGVRGRTTVALAGRYLALAATGVGASTFQQPPPASAWLDPWWLFGAAALMALGARTARVLARRDPEAGFWLAAAIAFAPVSQIGAFVFQFPMADRYVYAMLPGLLGGALLATRALRARIAAGARAALGPEASRWLLALPVAAALALLAAHAHARAAVWRSGAALMIDAARHYPGGVQAQLLRASGAARAGDAAAVGEALRSAFAQGYTAFAAVRDDPTFGPVLGDPAVRPVLLEMARWWTVQVAALSDPPPGVLMRLAEAHELLGEREPALAAWRRLLAEGGDAAAVARPRIAALEAQ